MFEDGEGGSITWQPPTKLQAAIDTLDGEKVLTLRKGIEASLMMFHSILAGSLHEANPIALQSLCDHLAMVSQQALMRIQNSL